MFQVTPFEFQLTLRWKNTDFSKWLQYYKEWQMLGGLNTFHSHCILLWLNMGRCDSSACWKSRVS